MHPEDIANEKQAKKEVTLYGHKVANERYEDLVRLMTIYADDDAKDLFEEMREWFWAIALPNTVEQAEIIKTRTKSKEI